MNYKKIDDNSWIITVQENGSTKELFIEFPPGALDQVGWDEGDELIWEELDHGKGYSIKKKPTPPKEYPVDSEITKGTRMDDNYYFFRKEDTDDK